MGKKSIKQRAYLSEHRGNFSVETDGRERLSPSEVDEAIKHINIVDLMASNRVKEAMSRQSAYHLETMRLIQYGKESLAFGYLVGMVYNRLKDYRERIQGLKGMSDHHFDIVINRWVVSQFSHGVFKASQLIKHTKNAKHIRKTIKEVERFGLIVPLTAVEVNTLTGLVVSPHAFASKYYRLSRETNKMIDEFNLMFARVYKDFTRNCWLSDLERL